MSEGDGLRMQSRAPCSSSCARNRWQGGGWDHFPARGFATRETTLGHIQSPPLPNVRLNIRHVSGGGVQRLESIDQRQSYDNHPDAILCTEVVDSIERTC